MKKIIIAAVAALAGIAAFAVVDINSAKAGIFDDVFDAVTGHVTDIKDRITVDEVVIDGKTITSGEFRKDDIGRDPAHWANGTVSVRQADSKIFLQLESDFESGPAPDLYVYFADRKVVDEGTFWDAKRYEVGKVKRGSGASAYELTDDLREISKELGLRSAEPEVVIWCKRFGAFIGAASLTK